MRLTAQEKQEIINLVEGSDMGIHRCLQHLGIAKSNFFKWYKAYRDKGLVGLHQCHQVTDGSGTPSPNKKKP